MTTAFILWIMFFLMICAIALLSIGGWVAEGLKNEKSREEIKRLEFENRELRLALRRKNRKSNIDVADDYYKELYKDEGNS